MRERKRSTVLARYSEMYKLNNQENNFLIRNVALLQWMLRYVSFIFNLFISVCDFYFDTDICFDN